jgi:putative flippase GtrA
MRRQLVRFYAVGLAGVVVQLSALAWLTRSAGMDSMLSTALAVEIAVVHNFMWHDRWTWPGRPSGERVRRFWKFNVSTGAISICANVLVTGMLVSATGLPLVAANAIAIALASLATYLASDLVVFRVRRAAP